LPCDVFITEATFGLPVFRHGDAADEVKKLLASVGRCFRSGRNWSAPIRSARRKRVIALLPRPVTTRRSICMAR